MDHKLHVLVRLDIDSTSAVLEVTGCLTEKSCQALFPLIRRTGSLLNGLAVDVDLSGARHIDPEALAYLRDRGNSHPDPETAFERDQIGCTPFTVQAPEELPSCPAQIGTIRAGRVVAA